VKLLAEAQGLFFAIDPCLHASFAEAERGLDRIHDPAPAPGFDEHPVENHGDRSILGFQLGFFHRDRPSAFEHACESCLPEDFS